MIDLRTVTQVKLGDKEYSVSVMPFKKMIDLQKKVEKMEKSKVTDIVKQIEVMADIIFDILSRDNENVDKTFLEDELTLPAFQKICKIAMGTPVE